VDILAKRVRLPQKRILILGAGGSAKAIAYALLQQGAQVTLCNRTLARAHAFVQQFGGDSIDFEQLRGMQAFSYEAVINTLPVPAFQEQCADWSLPQVGDANQKPESPLWKRIAMDIVYRDSPTPFITMATAAGWDCIPGDALFTAQAERQLEIWFGESEKNPFSHNVGEGIFYLSQFKIHRTFIQIHPGKQHPNRVAEAINCPCALSPQQMFIGLKVVVIVL
jgi:shikimate 5-dehydrogenase